MIKRKIIYIGNQLAKSGKNPTPVDTLGEQLKELAIVVKASSKRNVVFRLIHMLWTIFCHYKSSSLVLIDTYSTLNFYYALTSSILCRILKIPYATYLHGGNLPFRLEKNPKMCSSLFSKAKYVISPSEYLANSFRAKGFAVRVIPNNIYLDQYRFKQRNSFDCNMIYVRALQDIYNPEMAIKVLSHVRSQLGVGTLCFVGPDKDNSLPKLIKLSEELQLTKYIKFTGKLSKKEWTTLSEEFDVFINTTHFDNMPVSVIEGMSLGLPVISTNVGGLPYMIKDDHNGILINDNDFKGMAEAVISLYEDRHKIDYITKNAYLYVSQMDWKVVKHSWSEIINDSIQKTINP